MWYIGESQWFSLVSIEFYLGIHRAVGEMATGTTWPLPMAPVPTLRASTRLPLGSVAAMRPVSSRPITVALVALSDLSLTCAR